MNYYLLWILMFIPNLLIKIFCLIFSPLVACFITSRLRTDRVKQIDNQQHTLLRDYLIKPFYWFQTHDNAVDEYWYGAFNKKSIFSYLRNVTQSQYDSDKLLRYICRVMWLWRNCGYGFSYNLFGIPLDSIISEKEFGTKYKGFWYLLTKRQSSFQLEVQIPTWWSWYININIGWKSHDGFPRVMYADRIFGTKANK